ncbi:aquaporin SIP1-2-like [Zingiber officinale]|uniref:aquaporin SIP1-2-like n=1 Tax=Zingiber officinale TaxID=94328 RepID=UPI001C4B3807|nr:aquaporin SIP1-2-like [Zingiber officinale]
MGAVKAAVGDALITFVWMFCISGLGFATFLITAALEIQGAHFSLLVTASLIFVIVFTFNVIADAMGGASFNPTGNAAFYAAGFGEDTLISMALRFPAQAAGAVGGLLALYEVMPPDYKHLLVGPSLKVDLHTGAIAEGALTFVITTAVLWIIFKGPPSPLVKALMITICTLGVITAGDSYTGPSMNPANAYGWAYLNNRHNNWEQFYVYWICPFIGAISAGWLFRVVFPPRPPVKAKKA